MILYNSNYFGLLQLTTFSGSAVYRTILPSLISTFVLFVFKFTWGHGDSAKELLEIIDDEGIDADAIYTGHPFVITIYIMSLSLIINHRLNYCYQRYWESCSNIFMMTSKWTDSATALGSFHYQSTVYDEDRPRSFGDEDKPLDQMQDKDKNKSAPTGGNTRIAMVNSGGLYSVEDYTGNRKPSDSDTHHDGLNGTATSGSDTSENESSLFAHEEPSSLTASANHESSKGSSRPSFLSTFSRERARRYSEEENLKRAKRRFSGNTESSFRQVFTWKSTSKTTYQSTSDFSDLNQDQQNQLQPTQSQSSRSENAIIEPNRDSSSIKNTVAMGNISKNNRSDTPPRDNMLTSTKTDPRLGLLRKIPNNYMQLRPKKRGNRVSFSLRSHGVQSSDRSADNYHIEGTSAGKAQNRHRRVPSTDIPKPGAGGDVVKSFKLNPSLAWQIRNRAAMPRNTGLHSTVFETPIGLDFEKLLLEEAKERKADFRQQQLQDWKERQGELHQKLKRPSFSDGFLASARRRSSIQIFKKPIARSNSITNTAISRNIPNRIRSEPSLINRSVLTQSTNSNSEDFKGNSQRSSRLPNMTSRLELYDLPSLYRNHTVDNSKGTFSIEPAIKKDNLDPFFPDFTQHHNSERQSSLRRSSVGKMNGRASLFLQEAAHLYSLMSAVAMSSLRADMEGVSSPLVDYVPGQKFPPVNPEEMQIKVLVTKQRTGQNSKYAPSDYDGNGKIGPQNDKSESEQLHELRVRIQRKNKFKNIFMHLFGMTQNSRERTIYNASRPFSVLGGISNGEVEMLRKVRGHSAQHALCCLWLREFITREHLNGSTGNVGSPIVARVYQHLSDGSQQYNNARKTAFTDFPFPHAQLTSFFGFVSIFIFPLLYYTYVNSTSVAVVLNFFTLGCFFGIQEVALELEQPFIRYPNDLPLNNYQAQFNEALISSLYGGFHPDAWGETDENGGIFSACCDSIDSCELDNESPTPSETSSPDLSVGHNSISSYSQDGIEGQGATSTDGQC